MRTVFVVLLGGVIVLAGCTGGPQPTDTRDNNDSINTSDPGSMEQEPMDSTDSGESDGDDSGDEPSREELGEAWAEWRRTPAGTLIYENNTENGTYRIEADRSSEVYDVLMTSNIDVPDNEFIERRGFVAISANVTCGLIAQVAYNYTDFTESLEESNLTNDTTPDTAQDLLHRQIFMDYTPRNVEVELYNLNGSTKLASCDIEGEDELNKEIYVGE